MKKTLSLSLLCLGFVAQIASAEDWPQWRGANRDGKISGFTAPATWPKEMTKKWQIAVGDGVATPALVDGKLYVFTRKDGKEILRCLDAKTGEEKWQDSYSASTNFSGDREFQGPRSTPAVASGKVVTLGVTGILSCVDAASGKVLWRKEDFKDKVPMFHTSSSPIIVDGLAIAQFGGGGGGRGGFGGPPGGGGGGRGGSGGIVAYELDSGNEKWKWNGGAASYASPALMKIGDTKAVFTVTDQKLVAVNAADGTLLWDVNYSQGRYNSASPVIDGTTLIYAGPGKGLTAEKVEIKDGKIVTNETWKAEDASVQFNTPVLRDGLIYGISNTGSVFCVSTDGGKLAWSAGGSAAGAGRGGERGGERGPGSEARPGEERPGGERGPGGRGPGGRGFGPGGGMRGGRGGGGGYGSVVDAGKVLFSLTPSGKLVVFEPTDKEFKQIASYEVGSNTYAYPIPTENGIYVKDKENLTLWTVE